jgi:hypothetical protein
MPNTTVPAADAGLSSTILTTLEILSPLEDPICQAIYKLTALSLIIEKSGAFIDDDERAAVVGLVDDALDFAKVARDEFFAAWDTAKGEHSEARAA